MKWMDKLERKFGKYAISNLMFYIIILYVAGFLLSMFDPSFYYNYLCLNAEAIMHGQVWRLFTFLIQPPPSNSLFIIFALYLYYMIGRNLEYVWGAFRFNLYFFMGVLFNILATFVAYAIFGVSLPLGTYYLNTTLFLSYAAIFSNQQFYLFFFIPVKVKWLAWIEAAYFGYDIIKAFLPQYGGSIFGVLYKANALEIVVALLNFIIFFIATRNKAKYSPKEIKRRKVYQKAVQEAKQSNQYENGAKHRCHVCGRTELDDDTLEFRYCSKCNGNYEYCQDHLFTHEHVK